MIKPQNFYDIVAVVYDLSGEVEKKLGQYNSTIWTDKKLRMELSGIEYVYMSSIILDLAKIFSLARKDESGLKKLKECSPSVIRDKFFQLQKSHNKLLEKLKENRNRLIAHVDISKDRSVFRMTLSKSERIRMIKNYGFIIENHRDEKSLIEDFAKNISKKRSRSHKNERYSPVDLIHDAPEILRMLKELKIIVSELVMYFYKKESKLPEV